MRAVLEKSNVLAVVEWLQTNDRHFADLTREAATKKLKSLIERKFSDLPVEEADTDKVHEVVWRGVLAVVAGGGIYGFATDQRQVTLYAGLSQRGGKGWVQLGYTVQRQRYVNGEDRTLDVERTEIPSEDNL